MSSQYKHPTSSSSDLIYYDMVISNLQNEKSQDDHQLLKFFETRQTPIVERAEDYYMSIVRFQVDTFALPVYIAEIIPNQSDINKMIHSFTLRYTTTAGVVYESSRNFMVWEQNDFTKSKPSPPDQNVNGIQSYTSYYYAQNYYHLVKIMNTTLKTCVDQIYDQFKLYELLLYPFFTWNTSSNALELYTLNGMYNSDKAYDTFYGKMEIYFNSSMYALINGMPSVKYGIQNPLGKHYKLLIDGFHGVNIIPGNQDIFGTNQLIKTVQEYSSISIWSPVASIVFATSTLPVSPNQLSSPYIYQDGQLVQFSSMSAQSLNIITDMSTDESYKPSLLYIPSGENRYINLYNNGPINQIDIQVYYRLKTGLIVPFYLPSGSSCSMKFLFKKKYI